MSNSVLKFTEDILGSVFALNWIATVRVTDKRGNERKGFLSLCRWMIFTLKAIVYPLALFHWRDSFFLIFHYLVPGTILVTPQPGFQASRGNTNMLMSADCLPLTGQRIVTGRVTSAMSDRESKPLILKTHRWQCPLSCTETAVILSLQLNDCLCGRTHWGL